MRIIAGSARGSLLETLEGEDTRPTLGRVKEGIFSAVQFLLPGAKVLDLFAGSGQLGLEAISRGAQRCVFIDLEQKAVSCIKSNAQKANLTKEIVAVQSDVFAYLRHCTDKFDVIFIDPPYNKNLAGEVLQAVAGVCENGATVFLESEKGAIIPAEVQGLVLKKQYSYGTVCVSKFCKE